MSKLKYKVGDQVKIKSLDWYNENKDEDGDVFCGEYDFVYPMTKLCGKIVTITCVNTKNCYYVINEDDGYYSWTDEMIVRPRKTILKTTIDGVEKTVLLKFFLCDKGSDFDGYSLCVTEDLSNPYPSEIVERDIKTYSNLCEIIKL